MVTTVSRVLATLVAATLLVLGAPLTQDASAHSVPQLQAGQQERSTTEIRKDATSSGASSKAHEHHDRAAVASALPNWSGDHRPAVRDIPEGYTPVEGLLPDLGAAWARVPLPESTAPPDLNDVVGLPLGRDPPPLTGHV